MFTARFESGSAQSPSKTHRRTRHVDAAGEDEDDEHAVVCVDDATSAERVGRDPFSFDDGCGFGEFMVWHYHICNHFASSSYLSSSPPRLPALLPPDSAQETLCPLIPTGGYDMLHPCRSLNSFFRTKPRTLMSHCMFHQSCHVSHITNITRHASHHLQFNPQR